MKENCIALYIDTAKQRLAALVLPIRMHLSSTQDKVYVAGHGGLVGSALVRKLRQEGFENLVLCTRQELDLRDQAAVYRFFEAERPAFVVLAAAKVGGILANATHPAEFIGDNLSIQTNVIRGAHQTGVKRLLFLSSSAIYPKHAAQPLKEEYLLSGPLEPTNQWYAIAKIAGLKMCEAYRKQYGDDFLGLLPTNLYGPNDHFEENTSHVLPALLRRFHDAKGDYPHPDAPVTLWGTGTPRREFLYCDDLADACLFVLQQPAAALYDVAPDGLLNVGIGEDIEIRTLAEMIRDVVGSQSKILFDASKPDGTPRKLLDVSKMFALGWSAKTTLSEGLRRTYTWYREQVAALMNFDKQVQS